MRMVRASVHARVYFLVCMRMVCMMLTDESGCPSEAALNVVFARTYLLVCMPASSACIHVYVRACVHARIACELYYNTFIINDNKIKYSQI